MGKRMCAELVVFEICYRKFVGNRSTMTQYTVLIPRLVSASNTQERTRFIVAVCTKYSPNVTPPATIRLNTVNINN